MHRLAPWIVVIVVGGGMAACRCSSESEADAGASGTRTVRQAEGVVKTRDGETVVVGPQKVSPSPPPLLPGERRRKRGAAPHPEPTSPDPVEGEFTLEQATEGLEGDGPLVARFEVGLGELRCTLDSEKAPRTVANFVGLARGKRPWWDPYSGSWVTRPFYNGLNFYKVLPGTKIEGGCPLSLGTGGPGYLFTPEIVPGFGHDEAGVISMVVDEEGHAGSRFFITDGPAPQFNGRHAPFGRCEPTDVIFRIARVPQGPGNRPLTDVLIRSIVISRGE